MMILASAPSVAKQYEKEKDDFRNSNSQLQGLLNDRKVSVFALGHYLLCPQG